MSHFNFKSLAFYGVAIGSVVLLFKVVTDYGNANLKAPPSMGGTYRILAKNLPGCLSSNSLLLNIQQSGTYLFASLLPADTDANSETSVKEKYTLDGQLQNQQINLSGTVPGLPKCEGKIKIQGSVEEKAIAGQIALDSLPGSSAFKAQQEEPAAQTQTH